MFKTKKIKDLESRIECLERSISELYSEINESRKVNNSNVDKIQSDIINIVRWMSNHDGTVPVVH